MPRPSHYQPSPTSSLFCAQAPTSSLLCSGSNICSILHEACHAQTPTYQAPISCLLWPGPNMFLPTSCLLCSGPYIITPVLHQACHAQVPTANRLYLCPNICLYPTSACYTQAPTVSSQSYIKLVMCQGSYIKPAMLRLQQMLHPTLSLLCSSPYIHQAGSYIKPVMPRPLPMLLSYMKPVMPRPLHQHPSPVSSLSCSGPYIQYGSPRKPVMLRLRRYQAQHTPQPSQNLVRD